MADPVVPSIEGLGVDTVQVTHPLREIAVRCFNEEMVVVVHEAICVAKPVVASDNFSDDSEELLLVRTINKDV
jgi:hypothetical protein